MRVFDVSPRTRGIEKWQTWWSMCLKPWIVDYVDPRHFDFLLYLDADVLATAPRLEQIVSGPLERGRIAVQRDILKIRGNHRCTARDELTEEEKLRFGDEGICAGIVGVPTNRTGLELLRDWRAAIEVRKYNGGDQVPLYPLLLRGFLGRWEYLTDTVIARKTTHPEALQHFSNGGGVAEKKLGREDRLFYETFARLAAAGGSSAA